MNGDIHIHVGSQETAPKENTEDVQDLKNTSAPPTPDNVEDVEPIDTSFFCSDRFSPDIIEKNIMKELAESKGKADACRRLMTLDACGYIQLRNKTDNQKAECINPFAKPRYTFTGDDFCKARKTKKH